ncbi:MAG: hypothetical protein FJZ89_04440, partial [Chloroflexi bacterium]|nr:hypothetical protein [Chloroflexota bacterium]
LPPASCLLPPASCLLPPASCLLPPASCLLPLASCLLPPASCLLPPIYWFPALCSVTGALPRRAMTWADSRSSGVVIFTLSYEPG